MEGSGSVDGLGERTVGWVFGKTDLVKVMVGEVLVSIVIRIMVIVEVL